MHHSEDPPKSPLKRGTLNPPFVLPLKRGTLNPPFVPPLKSGALNPSFVPPFLRGARGDLIYSIIKKIGIT
jgi:hypothetical protein